MFECYELKGWAMNFNENEKKNKVWTQAAIDVYDMDLAKQIAKMALDEGSEWLEVGTPLLYTYGIQAIAQLREYVGKNAVLVPDFKTPIALLCAKQAKEMGADYIHVCSSYIDKLNEMNFNFCLEVGITPIFDVLQIRPDDIQMNIDRLAALGAKHFFVRHYHTYTDKNGNEVTFDTLKDLKRPENSLLGVTNDDFDDAVYCAQNGADWIIFGQVLRNPNRDICKKWISSIHKAGNEK